MIPNGHLIGCGTVGLIAGSSDNKANIKVEGRKRERLEINNSWKNLILFVAAADARCGKVWWKATRRQLVSLGLLELLKLTLHRMTIKPTNSQPASQQ